jgi:aquaporin Z
MFKNLLAEFIGTFVLLSVILAVVKSNLSLCETGLAIGLGLSAAIFMMGSVSGGHFNPVVSLVMLLDNKIDMVKMIQYVVAQGLGGAAALLVFKMK